MDIVREQDYELGVVQLNNVRLRELNVNIQYDIEDVLDGMWMRYNTPDTRAEIVLKLEAIFHRYRQENLLYNFKITCDNTNNPPNIIDNHGIIVDIVYEAIKGVLKYLRVEITGTILNNYKEINREPKGQIFCEFDPYGEENWDE